MSVKEHCEDRQDPRGVSDGRHPVYPDHRRLSRKARGVPGSHVLDLRLRAIGKHRPQGRDALEGNGPQRPPQKRWDRRLEEVAKAVGGGYCRL